MSSTIFFSLASNLNNEYNEIGELEINQIHSFHDNLPNSNPFSMYMSECTTEDNSTIITELKNGKASDIHVIKKPQMLFLLFYVYCTFDI